MSGLVPNGLHQRKREKGVALLGQDLRDHREELFTRMVCDGVPLGVAFKNAGFTSEDDSAPSNLWHLDRVQQRAAAILEARATQGVVTLPEVTDMLQRVFTGALHRDEYSAAHNAAFSLARLYGHVTDKSQVEVIRRPSRDPDAPSEQALASWVNSLPVIEHEPQAADPANPADPSLGPSLGAFRRAPADLLGTPPPSDPGLAAVATSPADLAAAPSSLAAVAGDPATAPSVSRETSENINDFNALAICSRFVLGTAGGRPENGAPTGPVTGTPDTGRRSGLLETGTTPLGGSEKGAPLPARQVPVVKKGRIKTTEYPSEARSLGAQPQEYPPIEDLF